MKTAPLECNNVVLRLSEVYLIAAEAGCKLGGDAAVQGLGYLNDIVKRGNPENEVTMADYTLDRVLDERSKELVGEGHRFFDVRRWMIAEDTDNRMMHGFEITRNGERKTGRIIDTRQHTFRKAMYFYPIPYKETVKSPDLLQNPYYE